MAKVKTIGASYGISFEFQNSWHKFNSSIEVELEEGDNISKVKEMAYNTVKNEVVKQVDELVNS